ncbi:unnamed protein product [Polarella glacialis]|uniref:Dynamin N-terminal domain-containing protein n=1 Tax=Polarella glacialis TaxID=89957 RepID=A0A813LXL4_POLGL|nr:unnamed protein product [Polarella glacialis]
MPGDRPGLRPLRRRSLPALAAVLLVLALAIASCIGVRDAGEVRAFSLRAEQEKGNRQGKGSARQEGRPHPSAAVVAAAATAGLALALGIFYSHRRILQGSRRLKRPYELRDWTADPTVSVEDAEAEMIKMISWLQEAVIIPIDKQLPGRPFEYHLQHFPFTATVLIIGNHSSGKSTFINRLLGSSVQETGVAPTDDGFTVLERHAEFDQFEDGPTLMGCPENRAFRDLRQFGRAFSGNFRRKRMVLPESSEMPFGLQIVDSPGMIDLPGSNQSTSKARGYNFIDVVRWWATKADLILLLFDPDKPGTTGETLDVLTKSLAGLDHKFLVVLNKVDQLDNNSDFARAYGTLSWALSKVIPQKDIPMIWTMYNEKEDCPSPTERRHELPLRAFQQKRREVIKEVLRAKVRHWDNVVTSLEECLRHIGMVAAVLASVCSRVRQQTRLVWGVGGAALAVPWLAILSLLAGLGGNTWPGPGHLLLGAALGYALVCLIARSLMQEYLRQFESLQVADLETHFRLVYRLKFIHSDSEDLCIIWETVRPQIENILRSVPSCAQLPVVPQWEIARIPEVLNRDISYLRQLAKVLRPPEPGFGASGMAKSGK